MNYKVGFVVALVVTLSGCAGGPGYKESMLAIPAVPDDHGRIYFYRKSSLGAAIQPEVRLNDEVVGRAKPKGFFYADRPGGEYVVSASTEAKRSLSFKLAKGEEKFVRLEVKMGAFVGHVKPVLVEAEVGRKELEKTKAIAQ